MYSCLWFALLGLLCLASELLAQSTSTSAPPWPVQTYRSNPTLQTSSLNVSKFGQTSPGYLFYAKDGALSPQSNGPMIKTDNDELIWQGQPGSHALGFSPQTYKNQPVLVYWTGTVLGDPVGLGYGNIVILDSSYTPVVDVSLTGNWIPASSSPSYPSYVDLHESTITDQNTLLIIANNLTTWDLRGLGGPEKAYIIDARFYEIDIASNKILFCWSALDHLDKLPMSASLYTFGYEGADGKAPDTAWNYFHMNSVGLSPDKKSYIISSRYLCAGILINRATGAVEWILQGSTAQNTSAITDFHLAPNSTFSFQHDLRLYPSPNNQPHEVLLSMHDNANSPLTFPNPTIPSSGLLLSLNTQAKTATALHRYIAGPHYYSEATGGFRRIHPSDTRSHYLEAHGFVPVIQEFTSAGDLLMTAQFGPVVDGKPSGMTLTYRAFRGEWTGCPRSAPDVVACAANGTVSAGKKQVAVYVSWNGATEVAGWVVSAGRKVDGTDMKGVRAVAKDGFETKIVVEVGEDVGFVQVRAVAKEKRACKEFEKFGTSAVVKIQ